jgi:hypothetical protein
MNTTPPPAGAPLFLALEFEQVRLTDKIAISENFRAENNFIAVPILSRLLDATLESAGQLVAPALFGGPLNHAFFVCSVRDANTAAKTLWPLLQELCLAEGAKLYRYDESERVLRCIFPAAGDVVSWAEFLLKALTAINLTGAGKARADELARLMERLKPTDPPGGDAKQ